MSFTPKKAIKVLENFHEGLVGKHFDNNITFNKV